MSIGRFGPIGISYVSGGPVRQQSVRVVYAGTDNLVTIFNDRVAGQFKSNPLDTDEHGNFFFYAEEGVYDLIVGDTRITVPVDPLPVTPDVSSVPTFAHPKRLLTVNVNPDDICRTYWGRDPDTGGPLTTTLDPAFAGAPAFTAWAHAEDDPNYAGAPVVTVGGLYRVTVDVSFYAKTQYEPNGVEVGDGFGINVNLSQSITGVATQVIVGASDADANGNGAIRWSDLLIIPPNIRANLYLTPGNNLTPSKRLIAAMRLEPLAFAFDVANWWSD